MGENRRMRIDIMNRNTIISLAMLYALWQTNRQDLLDLIRPFVLCAVGNTTKVNSEIDTTCVCNYMEKEFGYKSIQIAEPTEVEAELLKIPLTTPMMMIREIVYEKNTEEPLHRTKQYLLGDRFKYVIPKK